MKRSFATGAFWSAASSWTEQAVGAVSFFVIARFIGVDEFGVAAMAFSFLFLGEFLVRDTVTEAIVQRESLEDGRLEATFVALVGFSLAIIAILFAVGQIAAAAYGEPAVALMLMAGSPTVLMIGAAGVSTALLRREMAYRVLAIRSTAGVACGGAVGIAMAVNGFGAWSLVAQRLTEIGVNSGFAIAAARWRPRIWPNRAQFLLLRGLGPQVVMLRSLMLVIGQTPTVMLGIFADARAAGLFALALRLSEIVRSLIIKPIEGVAQSAFAMLKRNNEATGPFFLDVSEVSALGAFTAFTGLALVSDTLVFILMGPEWQEASSLLPFLCVVGLVGALISVQQAYLLAVGRPRGLLLAALIEAAAGLVLATLASAHGAFVVAAAVAMRALVCLPFYVFAGLAYEKTSLWRYLQALIGPAIVATSILIVVGLLRIATLGHVPQAIILPLSILLGAATAATVVFIMMPKLKARLKTFYAAG